MGPKNHQFWPELWISTPLLHFEFTDGCEMMHKAWYSIQEVPLCFSRSSIEFQGHTEWKIDDLNPIFSKITRPVAAIKSLTFALLQMFWCSIANPKFQQK